MGRIIAVTTAYECADLLTHFVPHYFRLGVEELLLNVNVENTVDLLEKCRAICDGWPITLQEVRHEAISDDLKDRDERLMLDQYAQAEDWILHLDLDEFHQYPFALSQITEAMEAADVASISADFVDRIAGDGCFPPIRPKPSIFAQFPVGCTISRDWMMQPVRKVMLCRNWVRLSEGRHEARNAPVVAPVIGRWSQYRVHHFKWFQGVVQRLYYRGALSCGVNGFYRWTCRRMADSVIDNRIEPSSIPNYEWCGDMIYPSGSDC